MVQDDAVVKQRFVDLDALRGLRQLDSMRCTLSGLHDRYTAWLRLQTRDAQRRTVREEQYEKETRALIQKNSASFSVLWTEMERHRRIWETAEPPRMFDTTPLLEDEMHKLQEAWIADIRESIAKRRSKMAEAPATHRECMRTVVANRPAHDIAEGPRDERGVDDLVFCDKAASPSPSPESPAEARVAQPPAKRKRATVDPSACKDEGP